jgi:glutathione synthase
LRLLFVLDPLDSLKAYKDTSVAMMRAAQARCHAIFASEQTRLHWAKNHVATTALRLSLTDNDEDWYRPHESEARSLRDFDAVLMRKDPPFDLEYVATTWLLSAAAREGARVFNSPDAIRDHNEKLAIAEFARFVAPTLVTREPERIQAFIDEHRDTVVKRLDVMGGENVFRVRADDPNRNVIVEIMAQGGGRTVMAQRYIPEIAEGDKRVLLIEGKAVPHCLARIPKPGESRGNLAAGARGVGRELNARDRWLASQIGPKMAELGMLFVGLDVIGGFVTEINVTSPTGIRELDQQFGTDIGAELIAAIETRLAAR